MATTLPLCLSATNNLVPTSCRAVQGPLNKPPYFVILLDQSHFYTLFPSNIPLLALPFASPPSHSQPTRPDPS